MVDVTPLRTLVLLLVALFFLCGSASSVSTVAISPTLDGKSVVVCALTLQSRLNCSTLPRGSTPIQIPSGMTTYSGVVGGRGFVCALRTPPGDPSVSIMGCWRFSGASSAPEFKRIYRGPALSDLSAGSSHVCGIGKQSKLIQCWQWKGVRSPFVALKQSKFSDVSVGDAFVCGVTQSGNILCNGNETNVTGRGGTYQSLEAGPTYACAITADRNQLSCWGSTAAPANEAPRDDEFTSLALGDNRACALRRNQSVACWGAQSLSVPATDATFLAIKARGSVFCGVLVSNLSLLCWGSETETSLVFDRMLPGACSSSDSCQCGALPLLPNPCGSGGAICQSCPPAATGASSPAAPQQPESRSTNRSHPWSSNAKMVAFLVVGIVGCVSLAASMVFWYLGIRRDNSGSSRVHDSGRLDDEVEAEAEAEAGAGNSEVDDLEEGDRRRRAPTIQKRLSHKVSMGSIEEFPLQVLLQATNNFSPDLLIGNGSYGSVYKAELEDGRRIAVKRAEASHVGGTTRKNVETDTAFLAELGFLSKLNHKNLVRLLGFYEDNKERVLVYEYMSNGTLHDHLHKLHNASSPLATWPGRLKVALDAARGIEYLHVYAVPPVIHRDIKPSNILLDDTWTAKVSDFGLSLMGPTEEETHLSPLAAGTLGYIDPEYYRCHQLTTKSDIYSLGVVLLELLTGLKAIHLNENGLPRNVVDFVIPYIDRDEIHRVLDREMPPPTPIEIEALARVGYLAADCVSLRSRYRPSVTDIVSDLDGAWRDAACAPPTFFSSSANSSQAAD